MSYQHRVYRPDNTWWVDFFADDVARTATTYNEAGQVLVTRPYSPAENAQADARASTEAASVVQSTLTTDAAADLTNVRAAIDALAVLLGDSTVSGSVRQVMGAPTDPAGITTLRAWKSQTNANIVTSTSLKGLADLLLTLAQRIIDDTQADRKIARQTLRLALAMTGTYTSADVGAP